jgi:GT2 family glycosyltransferase
MEGKQVAGKVSAVIVTFNSREVLGDLLDSLAVAFKDVPDSEVVVADNASRDDSVAIARRHSIGARVIETGRNAGYAAAINIAAGQVAEDRALLILNPDIRLRPGAVDALLGAIARGAGIAVPRMVDEDGRLSLSVRREPSLVSAWSEALIGGKLASRLGLGEIAAPGPIYRQGGFIDWGTGACLLVSPAARRAIGAWDESYFLYSEETDYMRRSRQAGFPIVYVPAAEALHIGGEDHIRADLYALLTANRIRYYRRYHGPLATGLFRLGVMAGESLRMGRGRVHRAGLEAAFTLQPRLP